jgi:DNA-binding transcriptional LysR family regulator
MGADLELYRIFNAVVETGSFSGAAKKTFISQPAVSQAISKLENELGVHLLDRGPRGAALTKEGSVLYGYSETALRLIGAGERQLGQFAELREGELRIGAGDTVSKWFLLPLVKEFHRRYPDVLVSMTNRTTAETVALMREGRIDIGFVNLPVEGEDLICRECMKVHDVFVAG